MSDLIHRLRTATLYTGGGETESALPDEAATELARLTAEVARLREALWNIAHDSMFSSKDSICKYAADFAPKEKPNDPD